MTDQRPPTTPDHPDGVRLQKVLAQAGVASRRAAEELIAEGRVSVDGKIVREMGRRVRPDTAVVHVDGARIVIAEGLVHLALNKPQGILSTMSDDMGRMCVGDLIVERGIMDEQARMAGAGDTQPVQQVIRGQEKIGRNDPCHCGSGKKFKKCCAGHEVAR